MTGQTRLAVGTWEQEVRRAWLDWSKYRKQTFCSDCGENRWCGAARVSGPFLCLECFDLR